MLFWNEGNKHKYVNHIEIMFAADCKLFGVAEVKRF